MRWPGIEPGSTAWKAAMLTTIPPTQAVGRRLDAGLCGQQECSLSSWQVKLSELKLSLFGPGTEKKRHELIDLTYQAFY